MSSHMVGRYAICDEVMGKKGRRESGRVDRRWEIREHKLKNYIPYNTITKYICLQVSCFGYS